MNLLFKILLTLPFFLSSNILLSQNKVSKKDAIKESNNLRHWIDNNQNLYPFLNDEKYIIYKVLQKTVDDEKEGKQEISTYDDGKLEYLFIAGDNHDVSYDKDYYIFSFQNNNEDLELESIIYTPSGLGFEDVFELKAEEGRFEKIKKEESWRLWIDKNIGGEVVKKLLKKHEMVSEISRVTYTNKSKWNPFSDEEIVTLYIARFNNLKKAEEDKVLIEAIAKAAIQVFIKDMAKAEEEGIKPIKKVLNSAVFIKDTTKAQKKAIIASITASEKAFKKEMTKADETAFYAFFKGLEKIRRNGNLTNEQIRKEIKAVIKTKESIQKAVINSLLNKMKKLIIKKKEEYKKN